MASNLETNGSHNGTDPITPRRLREMRRKADPPEQWPPMRQALDRYATFHAVASAFIAWGSVITLVCIVLFVPGIPDVGRGAFITLAVMFVFKAALATYTAVGQVRLVIHKRGVRRA